VTPLGHFDAIRERWPFGFFFDGVSPRPAFLGSLRCDDHPPHSHFLKFEIFQKALVLPAPRCAQHAPFPAQSAGKGM